MNGEEVKRTIASKGYSISDVARKLEMSSQNLSKQLSLPDVRTGLLERIAKVIGVPVTYFFDHKESGEAIASGNYSAASVHGDATVSTSTDIEVLKERIKSMQNLLDEKERTIKILLNK